MGGGGGSGWMVVVRVVVLVASVCNHNSIQVPAVTSVHGLGEWNASNTNRERRELGGWNASQTNKEMGA